MHVMIKVGNKSAIYGSRFIIMGGKLNENTLKQVEWWNKYA